MAVEAVEKLLGVGHVGSGGYPGVTENSCYV